MRKPKTVIVIDNLYTGGVATSLYNFLYFVHDKLDIDLLVFNEESVDINKVPKEVKILKPAKILHVLGKKQSEILKESIILALFRMVMVFFARRVNGVFARSLIMPFVKRISSYDLAIAYAQDDSYKSISKGCMDYIIKKIDARHRSVIVHCDYSNFGGYNPKQKAMFDRIDTIICVSESCRKSFIRCFPSLNERTIACENFTRVDSIREMAGNGFPYLEGKINFVSACRLSKVKGLSRTIRAFSQLYKEGYKNFTWTIVGSGPEYDLIKKQIEVEGLVSEITLVGNKDNPYYFIKNASYLLLPSQHEAAPMVFGEAVCLGVPIISTATCSAIELVQDRGVGVVVDNSYEGIYEGLKKVIKNNMNIFIVNGDEQAINVNAMNQFDRFLNSIVKEYA